MHCFDLYLHNDYTTKVGAATCSAGPLAGKTYNKDLIRLIPDMSEEDDDDFEDEEFDDEDEDEFGDEEE